MREDGGGAPRGAAGEGWVSALVYGWCCHQSSPGWCTRVVHVLFGNPGCPCRGVCMHQGFMVLGLHASWVWDLRAWCGSAHAPRVHGFRVACVVGVGFEGLVRLCACV
eukprot:358017-Chlamydomonas_euryale.AAC.4